MRMRNVGALIVLAACAQDVRAQGTREGAELVEVRRIWDRAPHNAFTDLIRYQDRWFCTFREADAHVGGEDGTIRILVSDDGRAWDSASLLAEHGVDLRDPKLSITPDGRLMLLMGGSVYRDKALVSRRPRVAFSGDGRDWTVPSPILSEGHWLWRVTWHEGTAYGVSYLESGSRAILYRSRDGLDYEPVVEWDVPGANETTLRVLPDGEMLALVRCEAGDKQGRIGSSRPPYDRWTWQEIGHRLGGPNFTRLPDGRLVAGSRDFGSGKAETAIARMDRRSYEPILTLPSGGDTSYPGLVWHEGLLWVSYYSSHEGRTSIYLARVKLPPP
jgi:hypothetical protein